MQGILKGATKSRLLGAATGAAVTAVLQSSTATSVMLVGFVNGGIMTLSSALPVVMGANVGTTVTAQLVSLSGSNLFNVTAVGSLIGFVGFLMGFSKKGAVRSAGNVMLGFGELFIGLEIMSTTVSAFSGYELFRRLFTVESPLLLILNGFLITALVQSSSVVSSVMIILAINGVISFESSTYLILGTNIGAGVAVLLVASAMSDEARRVAVANVVFNVIGTAVCLPLLILLEGEIGSFFLAIIGGIERQIANFHTVFNFVTTAVLLPLVRPFEKLVILVSGKKRARRTGRRTAGQI